MIIVGYSAFSNSIVILGLIAFVYCVSKNMLKLRETCEFKLPEEKTTSVVIKNAGMLIFIVMSVLTILLNLIPQEIMS